MTNATQTRIPALSVETDVENMALAITFASGNILSLTTGMLSVDIANHALLHGLKQKLVDAAAISRNPDTGRSATVDDKESAVREVFDRLVSGQWNKGRADGEGNTGGLLLSALCQLYPAKTTADLREWLGTKDAAQKKALRETPRIATIMAEIKAARAKADDKTPDVDGMLDELND
jgi:hypothetical protein